MHLLENDPDPTPQEGQVLTFGAPNVLTEQFDPAPRWAVGQIDEFEERALSSSRWAGQEMKTPGL